MDNPKIREDYLNEKFFQKDKLLKQYFDAGQYDKFRTRVKYFKGYDKNLKDAVFALLNYYTCDILYRDASALARVMSPAGFLVLAGGAAINQYLPDDERSVTGDIDFKFVTVFKNVPVTSEKYFGYLQYAKLMMWNELGKLAKKMTHDKVLRKRIQDLANSPYGKCLQMDVKNLKFTCRYSIMHKTKQSPPNSNKVSKGNTLIDVELFAIDVKSFKFFSNKFNDLSGIFDFPFMRRGELGGKVMKGLKKGITYKAKGGRKIHNNTIYRAGKAFLLEDIYLMKSLGLRPDKTEKDRKRMLLMAKHVFKMNTSKDPSNKNIMNKTAAQRRVPIVKLQQTKTLPLAKIAKIDPYAYKEYTSRLTYRQIAKIAFPIFGPKNLKINNYNAVGNTRWHFDNRLHKWVRRPHRAYIRNTANYRVATNKSAPKHGAPPKSSYKEFKNKLDFKKSKPSVYGFSMTRNKWIPSDLLKKVAHIPLVRNKRANINKK